MDELTEESEEMEFKISLTEWRDIVETVSAFSNTKGGTIQVGVSDDGKIIGVEVGKNTIEKLANQIKQNTDTPVFPSITLKEKNGKKIIVIKVKESEVKPVFAFGRAFKRVGKSNQRLGSEEIRKLSRQTSKFFWDEQICKDVSLKDIDEEKIRWFLKEAKHERGLNISVDASVDEILSRVKLLKDKTLTNASILLFGKNPQKFFLQTVVRCIRFKGNKPVKPFIDMRVIGGNIIDQVDKALDFVLEHIPKAVWLAGRT